MEDSMMIQTVKSFHVEGLSFEGPATYRIYIKGALNEYWSDWLGGMSLTTTCSADHKSVTSLVGQLTDQAALLGVLNTLYDLHLPLLSVEYLTEPADAEREPDG